MTGKPTRKEARENARNKAREMRLAAKKKEQKTKILVWGSVAAAIAIIGGLVALIVVNAPKPVEQQIPSNMLYGGFSSQNPTTPILDTAANTSVERSEDKVYIDIYLDYLCPYCKMFEEIQGQVLKDVSNANDNVVVTYYPVSFLSEYSLVLSNAITCVAEYQPEAFWEVNEALFTIQPEDGAGRTLGGSQVKNIVSGLFSGFNFNQEVSSCVKDMRFQDYLAASTLALSSSPAPFTQNVQVSGTPFVLINGEIVSQDYLMDQEAMFFYIDDLAKKLKG
jgi:predicted transcriptional regulator with HTH domain